jgi:hypothetical protein
MMVHVALYRQLCLRNSVIPLPTHPFVIANAVKQCMA